VPALDDCGSYHEAALLVVGMLIGPLLEETGLAKTLPIAASVPQNLLDALIGEIRRYSCCPFTTPFRLQLIKEASRALKLFAAESGKQLQNSAKSASKSDKPRRSTPRKGSGEKTVTELKMIAALTIHHKYETDKCGNLEAIGVRELSRAAEVAPATASKFFKRHFFGSYTNYEVICQKHPERIALKLKVLSGEQPPAILHRSLRSEIDRFESGKTAE
jgi:hypothetical protein